MEAATILIGIGTVHLLAIASPGPTFVVVTSYALGGDRRAGFLVTLDGSSIVVHAGADDYMTDPPAGNSGDRIACGIVEKSWRVSPRRFAAARCGR